jgi:hypothetical protein
MTRSETVTARVPTCSLVAVRNGNRARVEQRAAVGWHAEVLEGRAAEQRLAGGQQPVPGQGRGVEGLFALLSLAGDEAVELSSDSVALVEQLAGGKQPALLGEQEEHHAHHHRDGGFIGVVGADRERVRQPRRFASAADSEKDWMSNSTARRTWAPEGFGDLLGGGDGLLEEHGEPLWGRRR